MVQDTFEDDSSTQNGIRSCSMQFYQIMNQVFHYMFPVVWAHIVSSTHPEHTYPNPHVLISDVIFGGLHDLDLVLT
jgi:hypothetical protein